MNPNDYDKLATFDELDREHTDHDRTQADAIEEGHADETGGELGRADWEDALAELTTR